MADKYVSSVDGNDGTPASVSWWSGNQSTYATLPGALGAASAGDTIYVDNAHAGSTASAVTLTSPGTAASPCRILCVTRSTGALATTATVTATADNSLTFSGYAYSYGIAYTAGSGTGSGTNILYGSGTSAIGWVFENCELANGVNKAAGGIRLGSSDSADQSLVLINSTIRRANASHTCDIGCRFLWKNTPSALTGTAPVTVFQITNLIGSGQCECRGVDLSATATTLVNLSNARKTTFLFENCKLGSGAAIGGGSITGTGSATLLLINCDSADTNYRFYKQTYQGTITQETTIVRTGGASDGTTPISYKMVTTANSQFYSPLESEPIIFWNETTGSAVTATVEVVTDNVTLKDSEAWLEVEYLGTSGFPISSFTSDRAADVLATGANQTTSSATWTTTGLTTPVKQKLSVSFTPQEKGLVRCRVMLAKASTTMYYCPKVDVT